MIPSPMPCSARAPPAVSNRLGMMMECLVCGGTGSKGPRPPRPAFQASTKTQALQCPTVEPRSATRGPAGVASERRCAWKARTWSCDARITCQDAEAAMPARTASNRNRRGVHQDGCNLDGRGPMLKLRAPFEPSCTFLLLGHVRFRAISEWPGQTVTLATSTHRSSMACPAEVPAGDRPEMLRSALSVDTIGGATRRSDRPHAMRKAFGKPVAVRIPCGRNPHAQRLRDRPGQHTGFRARRS